MTSTEHRSDAAILDRMSVNDVDTILDICRSNAHSDEVEHIVPDQSDALFTWDYHKGARPKLEKLYEKGKTSQWNANDLPWELDVDPSTIFPRRRRAAPHAGGPGGPPILAAAQMGRQGVGRVPHRGDRLAPEPVPPR